MSVKQHYSNLLETPGYGPTAWLGEGDGDRDRDAASRVHGRRLAALSIPAEQEYLAMARMGAMHVAGLLGFPVSRVTDFRLAVDEACLVFLTAPSEYGDGELPEAVSGMLGLSFESDGARLKVTVRGAAPRHWPDQDDVGWAMLQALVGELRAEVSRGIGTLTLIDPLARAR
jgi:hypothetical protein